MKCSTVTKRLTPYLDERLQASERSELEAHLVDCQHCRETHDLMRASRAALAAEGPAEPPPGLAQRVTQAALAASPREPLREEGSSWLRLLAWPSLATAGATAALALVLFAQAPGPHTPLRPGDATAGAAFSQLVSPEEVDISPLEESARMLGQEVE